MARIELSNIGGGGTTLSLTTTGTSGAATLAGSVLNIPVYQGQLTLTTTGTSGAATLSGDILNIPQYSGGGGTPAGSAGQVQFNSTPAGSFAASANLAWDNAATQLNIGTPLTPTGTLNVRGGGTLTTVNTRLTNSGNTELLKVLDNGNTNIGTNFSWDNSNNRLSIGNPTSPAATVNIRGAGIGSNNSLSVQNSDNKSTFRVRDNGIVVFGNNTSTFWFPFATTIGTANVDGVNQSLFLGGTSQAATFGRLHIGGEIHTQTSGDVAHMYLYDQFSPTSGTATTSTLRVNTQINQTGGANGITRGIYLTPLLTSAADWRTIEWNNNSGYGLYGVGTANNYLAGNTAIGTITPSARLQVRGANTSSGTNALLVQNSTPSDIYKIENDGKVSYWATNTAAGTTGAQTINRPSGTVNFAAGATALVVTNSLCTTASLVFAEVRTNDATAQIKNVVPAAGSFTINLNAAATAETSVGFFIIN